MRIKAYTFDVYCVSVRLRAESEVRCCYLAVRTQEGMGFSFGSSDQSGINGQGDL